MSRPAPSGTQAPSGAARLIEASAEPAAHIGREAGEISVREEVVDAVVPLGVRLSHAAARSNTLETLDAQPRVRPRHRRTPPPVKRGEKARARLSWRQGTKLPPTRRRLCGNRPSVSVHR